MGGPTFFKWAIMFDLTVSIVTYNPDLAVLGQTLSSVLGSELDLFIWVIDNSPTATLRDHLPPHSSLEYIHLPTNPGFGSAHNHVMRKIQGVSRYHLVLNPDTSFDPKILRGMVDFMDANPEGGLACPKVRYPDGRLQPLCRLLPSPMDVLLRRIAPGSKATKERNERYELIGKAYDRISNIPSVSGCFMLLRVDSLAKAGLFDEQFFMYFEDIDLSRRFFLIGKNLFIPHFEITHNFAKESYRSFKLLMVHVRSAIHYFNKWGWIFDSSRKEINQSALDQFD
jgi:GT2 family glycosyltransferase